MTIKNDSNYRHSTNADFEIDEIHSKVLKFLDYENNDISIMRDRPLLDHKYSWVCDNGHHFQKTLTQMKYDGCTDCNTKYLIPVNYLNYISSTKETIDLLKKLIKKSSELTNYRNDGVIQVVIAHLTYMFDSGLLSDDLVKSYEAIGLIKCFSGDVFINKDYSLMSHRQALNELKELNEDGGQINYYQLSDDLELWLQFFLSLHVKYRIPYEILKEFRNLGIVYGENDEVSHSIRASFKKKGLLISSQKTISRTFVKKVKVNNLRDLEWEKMLNGIMRHYVKNGHFAFIDEVFINGDNALLWLKKQEKLYTLGNMSSYRKKRILETEILNKYKNLRKVNRRWIDSYDCLNRFISKRGWDRKILPSTKFENKEIGKWVQHQYNLCVDNELTFEVMALFDKIGFKFDFFTPGDNKNAKNKKWELGFSKLIKYKNAFGCTNVPTSFEFEGFELGEWTYFQRVRYKNGEMSAVRIKAFKELGFEDEKTMPMLTDGTTFMSLSDFKSEFLWREMFSYLSDYIEKNSTTEIPRDYSVNGVNLYHWTQRQLTLIKLKKMPDTRIQMLTKAGVVL